MNRTKGFFSKYGNAYFFLGFWLILFVFFTLLPLGIAVVISTLRRMKTLQGKLLLQNIPPQPYKVLRAAGVEKIIEFREECTR